MSWVNLSKCAVEQSFLPQCGNSGRFIFNFCTKALIFLILPRTHLIYGIISGDELVNVPGQCSLLLDHCTPGERDSEIV